MIRCFLCPILTAVCLHAAVNPNIQGFVLDASSRPVPNAAVSCNGARTVSDSQGRFSFDSGAGCKATISREGFEPVTMRLEPGQPARVLLTIARRSDSVVVSATRTPTSIEESGVSATVYTASDLAARQYAPVADLLRDTAGINIAATGRRGAITSLFTRGAASTGTLLLLDGIPLNEPGGQIDLAAVTTAGLDRIEVVRGAESALFGAEAAAGVVQLFTATGDAEARRARGFVSYERGNFQTDHWTANLNGGLLDRIDYSLTADQFHTVGMFQNDYFRNTAGTANVGFRLSSATQVRAIYREYDAIMGNPSQVGYGVYDFDALGGNRDSALSVRVDDVRGSHFVQRGMYSYHRLRNLYENQIADGPFDIAALVRRTGGATPAVYLVQQVASGFPASSVPAGLELVTTTAYDYPGNFVSTSDRAIGDYQGTWTHRGGALVFGYRFERQNGNISGRDVERTNNGGFVHEQYSIGRRIFLTGGARYEHSSTFGHRFVPRGAATVQLFRSTFLRASGGLGYTEPSLLENFARELYYVGNPSLKPEKTAMVDAGIVQELFSRRVRLEATWFRNSFQDLIVFDSSGPVSTWSNIDRSRARGVETSGTVKLARFIEVSANYTRLDTKITRTNAFSPYQGVGQQLPRRPQNSGAAWISVNPRRWTLLVGGRVVGERQDSDYLFGITRNPGYGNLFLSGSYRVTKHLTPYLRMDNLLNEHYEEVLGYTALSRSAIGGVRVAW